LFAENFSDLAKIYRARAETFTELLSGRLTPLQFGEQQAENEAIKRRALDETLIALDGVQLLWLDKRTSASSQIGDRIGSAIASDSKTRAESSERVPTDLQPARRAPNAESSKIYREAMAAMDAGDKENAGRLFRILADQGYARAQAELGSESENARDYAEAAKWYRKAADQGNGVAQLFLGALYTTGSGVPQDYVLAHMWSNLAVSGLSPKASAYTGALKRRVILETRITPEQIAEAQKLAREWKPVQR
jgi:TPR repeat protein